MDELKPGTVIPDTGLTLKDRLRAEPWGEFWRATHQTHGAVIAALYLGADGPRLFSANKARIAVWQRMSASIPNLAKIVEITELGLWPRILIADGGGQTLREAATGRPMDARRAGEMALAVLRSLGALSMDTILPIGLSPDRLIEWTPGSNDWRILPVALVEPANPGSTGAGLYLPVEATRAPNPEESHADLFALTALWVQSMTGNFSAMPNAATAAKATPLAGLATMWRTNLTPTRGAFPEPRLAAMVLDKYLHKGQLELDQKAHSQAVADSQLPPWQQKLKENQRLILQGGLALLAIFLFISAFLLIPKMFQQRVSDDNPRGAAGLYFRALIDGDTAKALTYAKDEAELQTGRILEDIRAMEAKGLASKFAAAEPLRMGDASTNPIQAKTRLRGEGGDPFMEVELVLSRNDSGVWRVTRLFYVPLRTAEPEAPLEE